MPYVGPYEDSPVYRFEPIGYGVLEEYAYENREWFGDDPDWDAVREDFLSNVNDQLRQLELDIDDMNRRLVFHRINLEEHPQTGDWFVWLTVKDDASSFDDYATDSQMYMANVLAANEYRYNDGNDRRTDRRAMAMLINERERILDWMDRRLTSEGFRIDSYPTVNAYESFRGMNFGRKSKRRY